MSENESINKKPLVVAVAGPTASGKTALSVELCRRLNGEVISCDSMMVYRGMDIGTAKTSPEEMRGIPHYMLSVAPPTYNYSAAEYREAARACVSDILSRGRLPVFCGGTGLYLDAATRNMSFSNADSDADIRAQLESELEKVGPLAMHDKLRQVDAETALRLHPNDVRRVIRALEIYRVTGVPMSVRQRENAAENDELYDLRLFALNWDRAVLYRRIDERVDTMVSRGLFDEVSALMAAGVGEECTSMQAIGYKEAVAHLKGECSKEDAIALIKQRSRNYAKRQISWFRRDCRTIWIDVADGMSIDEMCEIVSRKILCENNMGA